jgi:hypothetical protein
MEINKFITIIFIGLVNFAFGQEELSTLNSRYFIKQDFPQYKSARANKKIIFLSDTLQLPFVDDFSKNRIRSSVIPNPNLAFDTVYTLFRVNGQATDSFKIYFDTTYFNVFDSVSGNFFLFPQKTDTVIFYSDTLNIGKPTDTIIGWPSVEIEVIGKDTTYLTVTPTSQGKNVIDTITLVYDSEYYYWTTNGAFWNNSLAIDQPTYGIITLDGADNQGHPYDMTLPSTYGIGDVLTSKPINLDYPSSDSIYLSFFYQPQGYGEAPNLQDSLTLEFYDIANQEWKYAWSSIGKVYQPFDEVYIFIEDSTYLKNGFQFRFKCYSTLSGSFDLWHLDYVRISRFRNQNDPIDDLAILNPPPSYLNDYTSVPWKQYKRSPAAISKQNFILDLNNLSKDGKVFTNYYKVYDEDKNQLFNSSPVIQPYDVSGPSASANSPFKVQHFLNSSPNNYVFPTSGFAGKSKVQFHIENSTNTTPDANRDNDTVTTIQTFDSYFAYDDGIAEQAYSINEAGAMLAYKFDIPHADTLKGLLINFPEMLEDQSDRRFRIMVWKNLDEGPVYEGVLREPITAGANNFVRFPLAEEVLVSGEFYVGWLQTLSKKLYVGFDFNIDNQKNIFYTVNNGINWYNTSFEGSLLIRPDFGVAQIDAVGLEEISPVLEEPKVDFSISPNPASNQATISASNYDYQTFNLYDVSGRNVANGNFTNNHTFDVTHLKRGVYFLHVTNLTTLQSTVKPFMIK